MRKTAILLTGSSGFIGRNILEQLHTKYTFYTPSHDQLDLTNINEVEKYFASKKIDLVIHCAGIVGRRSKLYVPDSVEQNLKMFFNIAKQRDKFKKMIHLGSGAEYDKSRSIEEISEEEFGKLIPQDQYGFYKYLCSQYALTDPKITVLRVFGVFGKYEDYSTRFISNNICRTLYDQPITINKNVYFDFIYINDLVKIIEYFVIHDNKERVFNVGTGKKIDLQTLAQKIKKLTSSPHKIIIKQSGYANEYTCNNTKLLNQIKNFKFTDIDKSIQELYIWYKKNRDQIDTSSFLD